MTNLRTVMAAAYAAAFSISAAAQVNDNNCGLAGFANYADLGLRGTTGGSSGEVVRVATREELARYAAGSTPYIIIIESDITGNGNIGEGAAGVKDYISLGSNKTIIGAGNGVTLRKVGLDANGQQNIILRNLRITGCNPDALSFRNTHHVWVDHCDLSSCADGLLDFTIGSSYLSVSWTKFSNHDKVSICNSGTNHFEDNGRERATYHHCWFDNTTQRNPRFGYGLGHVFNNYYTQNSSYCVGYHTRAKVVVENSAFKNTHSPLNQMYTSNPFEANYADALSRGNKFDNVSGNTEDTGTGFDIGRYYSYAMLLDDAVDVEGLSPQMGLADGLEHDLIPFPGNGATGVTRNDVLQVGKVENGMQYDCYVAVAGGVADAFMPYGATVLQPATDYVWYARAMTLEKTFTSSEFHFSTAPEKANTPTPEDGERHAQLREALVDKQPLTPMRLRWRAAFDATAYRVYLSEGSLVGDGDYIGETTSTELALKTALKYGAVYSWRVDAVKASGDVVRGDTWTFTSDRTEISEGKTELETAVRCGYAYLEQGTDYRQYSGGYAVVGEAGPGSMSMVWTGGDACCDITTTYFDWQQSGKYNGSFSLYVNDEKKDSWLSLSDGKNMIDHVSDGISLRDGDELRLEFYTDDKMRLRSDCITVVKSASDGIVDTDAAAERRQQRIYTVDGRYAGTDVDALPHGMYVVDGKTFVK